MMARVSSRRLVSMLALAGLPLLAACEKPKEYTTTIEVLQVQRFGQDTKAPGLMDLEVRFVDCGGDARRVVRLDKAFAQCAGSNLKRGDKVQASVSFAWNADRGNYRSDFSKIGECPVKIDLKDEANYELVQVCSDVQATGATVGVRCDRTRPKELLAKCPWLRRN